MSLSDALWKTGGNYVEYKKSGGLNFLRPPDRLLIWFVFFTAWPFIEPI
jgi:hypothetical protein